MKIYKIIAFVSLTVGMLAMYMIYPYILLILDIELFYIAPPFDPVIPNEETAIRVAEAILEVYYEDEGDDGFNFHDINDSSIERHVTYYEDSQVWSVSYGKISPIEGKMMLGGGLPEVTLRKDNGLVVSIGLSE